ncbi:hypothetical protein T07_1252 [Trichinella nelsoni]|uniref:Uncharacterized protein n=1 Tax=Trichinella nelsoni TaxID=6336 RepID=A0A0V0RAA0_9BILA|nr:hypothetical protein T07_1252 [Trichinella nelsoni]
MYPVAFNKCTVIRLQLTFIIWLFHTNNKTI